MSETAKFYTEKQKEELREYSASKNAIRNPITESTGARILDALEEQQNTLQNIKRILQRIEGKLCYEEQGKYFESAVSHALCGNKNSSSVSNNREYIKNAVQKSIRGTSR